MEGYFINRILFLILTPIFAFGEDTTNFSQTDKAVMKAVGISYIAGGIGGILGGFIGWKTDTCSPIGTAIGYTMGKCAEKIYTYVRKRLARQRRESVVAAAV